MHNLVGSYTNKYFYSKREAKTNSSYNGYSISVDSIVVLENRKIVARH